MVAGDCPDSGGDNCLEDLEVRTIVQRFVISPPASTTNRPMHTDVPPCHPIEFNEEGGVFCFFLIKSLIPFAAS